MEDEDQTAETLEFVVEPPLTDEQWEAVQREWERLGLSGSDS